jgi:WD40 repeat protein
MIALALLLSLLLPVPARAQAPQLILQTGHAYPVHAMAWSPEGRWLATVSADHTAKIWEAATGREVQTLARHTGVIRSVAWSPDGRLIATGSEDMTIVLWDVAAGVVVHVLRGHDTAVTAVAFTPDGRRLLSAGEDTVIRIWDAGTGSGVASLKGHDRAVKVLAVSVDGRTLASGGFDQLTILWDLGAAKETRRFKVDHDVESLAWSADGRWLATGAGTGATIWDVRTGQSVRRVGKPPHVVTSVSFSLDGRWLATRSGGGVTLWETATGREARKFAEDDPHFFSFSPDWRRLATSNGPAVAVWDVPTGARVHTLAGYAERVGPVAFGPDSRWLVTRSDNAARVWQFADGRAPRLLGNDPEGLLRIAISPDGRWLVTVDHKSRARLWDVSTGRLLRPFLDAGDDARDVTVAIDLRKIAAATHHKVVKVWEAPSGRELHALEENAATVAFTPDGKTLATGALEDGTVRLWDLDWGVETRALHGHSGAVRALTFAADGRWLASAGDDTIVRVWDPASGRELHALAGHIAVVTALVSGPGGKWLATGGADGILHLWDPVSGRDLRVLRGHSSMITHLAASPDGRWLASVAGDGSTRIWDVAAGREVALLSTMRQSEDWVVVTPDGLFDGSVQGMEKLVAWRIKQQMFPPDRFFTDYYSPGLLERVLSGQPPAPPPSIERLDLPPEVRILSPAARQATVTLPRLTVTVEAKDQGGGVTEVRLFQNGRLAGGLRGGGGTPLTFDIDLIPGENVLRAEADNQGNVTSAGDEIRVILEGTAAAPVLHVLAVGVNEYEDSAFDLGFARPDADALTKFFETHGKKLFGEVRTARLLDRDATRDGIRREFARLAREVKPEDVVVVYLAGHGVGLDQQFYFLPRDMRREADEEAAIRKYGMAAPEIGSALRAIRALKQILILDTCNSEAALPIVAKAVSFRGLGPGEQKAMTALARSQGVHLLAASTRQQFAAEVKALGHGVLTYSLLSGLGASGAPEAPVHDDGMVTVLSLLQYVNRRVPELTERHHRGHRQYPVSISVGQDFPLGAR